MSFNPPRLQTAADFVGTIKWKAHAQPFVPKTGVGFDFEYSEDIRQEEQIRNYSGMKVKGGLHCNELGTNTHLEIETSDKKFKTRGNLTDPKSWYTESSGEIKLDKTAKELVRGKLPVIMPVIGSAIFVGSGCEYFRYRQEYYPVEFAKSFKKAYGYSSIDHGITPQVSPASSFESSSPRRLSGPDLVNKIKTD